MQYVDLDKRTCFDVDVKNDDAIVINYSVIFEWLMKKYLQSRGKLFVNLSVTPYNPKNAALYMIAVSF